MSEKIDRLIDEMSGVREAVEELYLVLDHLWRNREEIRDLLNDDGCKRKSIDPTQTIYCAECGTELPLDEALKQGWEQLTGGCPDCLERDDAQVEATRKPLAPEGDSEKPADDGPKQKDLF